MSSCVVSASTFIHAGQTLKHLLLWGFFKMYHGLTLFSLILSLVYDLDVQSHSA